MATTVAGAIKVSSAKAELQAPAVRQVLEVGPASAEPLGFVPTSAAVTVGYSVSATAIAASPRQPKSWFGIALELFRRHDA
ncbi:MAG TPA: hypothetical protein VH229_02135, partial [Candidatus Udaeobacter sp.]|nr:hypothetical protein [Candidatus Udaeobacter sp.]